MLFAGIQELAQNRRERPSKESGFADMLQEKIPEEIARRGDGLQADGRRSWRLLGDVSRIGLPDPRAEAVAPEEIDGPEPLPDPGSDAAPVIAEMPAVTTATAHTDIAVEAVVEQTLQTGRRVGFPDLPGGPAGGGPDEGGDADRTGSRRARDDAAARHPAPRSTPRETAPAATEAPAPTSREPGTDAASPPGARRYASSIAQDVSPESFGRRDTEPAAPQLRVVNVQSTPAPAPLPSATGNPASASVLAALEANPGFAAAAAEATRTVLQAQTSRGETLHTLKIQLHPAELGTVTARLTLQGPQLIVELQVETSEARQRLNADSEAMMRALRAMGYEVDRVTIQQAPNTASNLTGAGAPGRDAGFQAGTGDGQQGSGARQAREDGTGGDRQPPGSQAEKRQDAGASGSLYI
jgi:chemotaxis protein MotD